MKSLAITLILLISTNALALPFLGPNEESIDCEYYLQREMTQQCGPDSYLVDFGYRYCHNFLFKKNKFIHFSKEARLWMTQVGHCLQNSLHKKDLEREAKGLSYMNCQQVEDFSFNMHSSCYITPDKYRPEISVCNLRFKDYANLTRVIKSTFKKRVIWKQIKNVIKICRKTWF